MRPSSSTWRSRTLRIGLLLGGFLVAGPGAARGETCLPPLFEGGQRLARIGEARVLWLGLLLRQHEVCRRPARRPGELRVLVFGNSGIFGFPLPAEHTAVGLLNRRFARQGTPAHLYNLAFPFTYQVKDAVILSEALRYRPDVIVYGTTLADYYHVAPNAYPPLVAFFDANTGGVRRLAAREPAGLVEPIDRYRDAYAGAATPWRNFRQLGLYLREGARELGLHARRRWFPDLPDSPVRIESRRDRYDCRAVEERFERDFGGWRDWSLLAFLGEAGRRTGAEVVVVNWPVAREPRGACHNVRYPTRELAAYRRWLRAETARLGFRLVDLQDRFDASLFVDSLHLGPRGQRGVADLLEAPLRDVLLARRRR